MRISSVSLVSAAAVVAVFFPQSSTAFTPGTGCRTELDPSNTCVATEGAGSSPICCNDDIRADCHPAGIAILQDDLVCAVCTGASGQQSFNLSPDTTLDLNGNNLICQESPTNVALLGVAGSNARLINSNAASNSRISVAGINACVFVGSTADDFTLGDSNLGELHFDACAIGINGNRARIENVLVLRPPGIVGIFLGGDDGVMLNAEFQSSGSDGPLEGITNTAPIGVAVAGERNTVSDVVVSAFPLAISVAPFSPQEDPTADNVVENTLVTDCLVGITLGEGATGNQIVGNTISCGECLDVTALPFPDEDLPVAVGDENPMCGTNSWSQNLLLTNCAEVPSFSTDQCELTDRRTDTPSESPSQSPPAPVPSPVSVPTPGGDNGGGGGGIACFSAMNTVGVLGKGVVSIDRLEIGDMVQAADGSRFSKVYSLAHKDDTSTTKYNQIFVKGSSQPLEITDDHLLLVNGVLAGSKSVMVGDMLQTTSKSRRTSGSAVVLQEVVSVNTIVRQGLYAPLTDDGTILVSGIAARCYVAVLPMLVPPSVQAWVSHTVLTPLRLDWFPLGSPIPAETYANGYSDRILPWLALASLLSTLPALFTIVLLTVGLPFLLGVALMEGLLLHHANDWRMYLLVVGGAIGWQRFFRKTKGGKKWLGVKTITA